MRDERIVKEVGQRKSVGRNTTRARERERERHTEGGRVERARGRGGGRLPVRDIVSFLSF